MLQEDEVELEMVAVIIISSWQQKECPAGPDLIRSAPCCIHLIITIPSNERLLVQYQVRVECDVTSHDIRTDFIVL